MKVTVLFFLCFMLIHVTKCIRENATDFQKWNAFKIEYAKHYRTPKEEQKRKEIFMENLLKITKHNKKFKRGQTTFEFGVNGFADMSSDEFLGRLGPSCSSPPEAAKFVEDGTFSKRIAGPPPYYKNWVKEGAVTRVKNQDWPLRCGCCWAFSATGAIESHNFIKTRKLVALSEQNLVDCVGSIQTNTYFYKNNCEGGQEYWGLDYVKKNRGIDTEQSYPYRAKKGRCRFKPEYIGAKINEIKVAPPYDEEQLKNIVGLIGPVTAGMKVEKELFHLSKNSGVYSNPTCGKDPKRKVSNHAVLLVGYGVEKDTPYWLVKNSWGPHWGLNGYFKIRRGTNECNISVFNTYPEI